MPVDDRRHLRDHFALVQGDEHVMTGLRQIGGETTGVDRRVEHVHGDAVEQGFVARFDVADFKLWRWHWRSLSLAAFHARPRLA
jgi:hypothetical protein